MSESDLRDFKAAMAVLESKSVPVTNRFGLLRTAMRLGMKCAAMGSGDPTMWRMLGEIELMRHEKFQRRSAASYAAKWNTDMTGSFDRAADYLEKAAQAGDEKALRALGHLYYGSYSEKPHNTFDRSVDRVRPSKALHYFRKALAAGSTDALFDIFNVLKDRNRLDLGMSYLRQACRRGHVDALVALASLTQQGEAVEKDDEEALRLLDDAQYFYKAEGRDDPSLLARMDFVRGLCRYGRARDDKEREAGLDLIRRAETLDPAAELWLKEFDKRKGDTEGSPMRFFMLSHKMKDHLERLERDDKDILAPLDDLVGLPTIKDDIARLVHLGKMQALRKLNGLKPVPMSMHMAFLGAPGTGKTTAARAVGKVLKDAGLLKKGHLVEVDRSTLVGQYIGQTEAMTRSKLEQALGGILFIDEAYALGNKDSARDFGNEAIETILKFMEDRRDDIVVIAAGYPEPMKTFFHSNPGIRSRFTNMMEFPAMKDSEAVELFKQFCDEHQYILDEGVEAELARHFVQLLRQGALVESNGRGVRTLFEQTISRQSRRVVRNRLHQKHEIVRLKLDDLPWDIGRARLSVVGKEDKA
jgi:TPR repeat protein